jgi:glycosyltransferase involved in cell wall biosynthesis
MLELSCIVFSLKPFDKSRFQDFRPCVSKRKTGQPAWLALKARFDVFDIAQRLILTPNPAPNMTILQVVPELATGGAERTTIEVAQAIVKAGGRALVWSAGGRLLPELEAVGGEHVLGRAASKNPFEVFVSNPRELQRLIASKKVDLVHARSRAPAWSALIAARRAKVPFVTTYHGIYNAKSALKRWYNSVMVRGDVIIANSHFTKAHLIAQHSTDPSQVEVIYRGVDIEAFDPASVSPQRSTTLAQAWGLSLRAARPRIILPARLTHWKGQGILLAALGMLKREGYDFEAILVGDAQGRSDYIAQLEAQIIAQALSGQVHLVGHCSDMPAAFSLCDIAVTPSTEPEAFGRTAAEAQAMGLPIIASDLGGAKETIDPGVTGFLTKPGDAGALAQALKTVLDMTEAQRKAMGAAGHVRVRELFTTESLQKHTLALYQRLLRST